MVTTSMLTSLLMTLQAGDDRICQGISSSSVARRWVCPSIMFSGNTRCRLRCLVMRYTRHAATQKTPATVAASIAVSTTGKRVGLYRKFVRGNRYDIKHLRNRKRSFLKYVFKTYFFFFFFFFFYYYEKTSSGNP